MFADPQSWAEDGLCRQVDPWIFFPEKAGLGTANQAKSVCRRCEVRVQCLEYALETHEAFGVWGGLSPQQRERLLRERDRPAA